MERLNVKRRSLGLLAVVVAGVATVSLTMASCDGNSDPMSPGKNGGGKEQHALSDNPGQTVAVNRAGLRGSQVTFDPSTGDLRIANFNGGGVSTTSESPISFWSQNATGDIAIGGGVEFSALADDGETSSLTITRPDDGSDYATYTPTFTGGAVSSLYTATLYSNGAEVASIPNIPVGTGVLVYPPINPPPTCCDLLWGVHFQVVQTRGNCVWDALWNRCCGRRIIYNDVPYDNIDHVAFAEQLDVPGHYPYHHFNQIQVLPVNVGLTGDFTVSSEFTVSQ